MARRRKCSVCGLYRGKKPHSGVLHDAIRANRKHGPLAAVRRLGRKIRRRR